MELQIDLLNKNHDRKSFGCGDPTLDQYIQHYASQDIKRNISRVFVATIIDEPERIVGFFSLSANVLAPELLPESMARKLPEFPLPVTLLGRLAVSLDFQEKGVGKILLADAMKRVYFASQTVAVYALIVEALNENAKHFYEKFGFISLPDKPLKLFIPLQTIREIVS